MKFPEHKEAHYRVIGGSKRERQKTEFLFSKERSWNWDSLRALELLTLYWMEAAKGDTRVGPVGPFTGVHMPRSFSAIPVYSFQQHGSHSGEKGERKIQASLLAP